MGEIFNGALMMSCPSNFTLLPTLCVRAQRTLTELVLSVEESNKAVGLYRKRHHFVMLRKLFKLSTIELFINAVYTVACKHTVFRRGLGAREGEEYKKNSVCCTKKFCLSAAQILVVDGQ